MNALEQLHSDIDARVKNIRDNYPDWLCRQGCDGCCHRLAEIPSLTSAEWLLLREGLAALPTEVFKEVAQGITALAQQTSRPVVCPMLDLTKGACRVYAHRPVACRTYGFYVQRDKGLYCKDIETRETNGDWVGVVWGNHDTIDRRLQPLGETRELTEWFAEWMG